MTRKVSGSKCAVSKSQSRRIAATRWTGRHTSGHLPAACPKHWAPLVFEPSSFQPGLRRSKTGSTAKSGNLLKNSSAFTIGNLICTLSDSGYASKVSEKPLKTDFPRAKAGLVLLQTAWTRCSVRPPPLHKRCAIASTINVRNSLSVAISTSCSLLSAIFFDQPP